ncbi:MAG: PEGA domain-containing protein, partial [Myxococcota bacterium]
MYPALASVFAVLYAEGDPSAPDLARARAALIAEGVPFEETAPPAAPPAAPALLARGTLAYTALTFDQARRDLEAAWQEAARTGAAGLEPEALADLALTLALVRDAVGDRAAWDAFVAAAALAPARALDPARVPPRALDAWGRAQEAVRAGPHGALAVMADPSDARAWIDGRPGAAVETLPYGEHFVRIEAPGFESAGTRVTLAEPRRVERVALRLAAAPEPLVEAARRRSGGASA